MNYHIETVYLIANILFRNKKFEQSLSYLMFLQSLMMEHRKKFYSYFESKYNLLLSLNFNYSKHKFKAIQLLQEAIAKKNIDLVTQLDMFLSLIVFYYQKELLNEAQHIFSNFYHTDQWYLKKAGIIWTIKKNLIEILLQIDLGNVNLVDSRLKSFKRNYRQHLKEINQERVITYLKLIEMYYKNPEIATDYSFKVKIEKAFNWIDNDKEDIFMMRFFAWLKAKIYKQDVYTITLKLIK